MVVPRNAEATQQRLLDAALHLYAQRGYAGTCLDAILSSASSSKGAFYHHFDSKEALTARALELHWQAFLRQLTCAWQSEEDNALKLTRLLEALRESSKSGCPVGLLGFESRSLPPLVQGELAAGFERWTDCVGRMLAEFGLNDEAQRKRLAQLLFVLFEGGVLIERLSPESDALEHALKSWHKDVLEALRLGGPVAGRDA